MKELEIIILIIQAGILIAQVILIKGQLDLSKRVFESDLAQTRSYFLPEKTNIPCHPEICHVNNDIYDLTESMSIYVNGKDDVFVRNVEIRIDGHVRPQEDPLGEVFFTADSRFGKLSMFLKLTNEEMQQETTRVEIALMLRNTRGYNYTEELFMTFHKDDKEKRWEMRAFNLKIHDGI